jgi:hypothetical protein
VVVEQVEAGELGERHPIVEHRIRLAAEHLDRVPEIDERLGEVPGVDALATDVRLPPVREVRERQRRIGVEGSRFGHPDRLAMAHYR